MTDGTFIPLILPDHYETADWQAEDLAYLEQQSYSANWSEMGCYKTTTGLWLIDRKVKSLTGIVPIVMIVTSRSGKGTYFDAMPKSITGYKVYDIDNKGASELNFVGTEVFRIPYTPEAFAHELKDPKHPVIILAHYHCFMNKSKMMPILKKLGYAFILVDEAHRIKEKDNQWTRNIKGLTCYTGWKHVMTGTGFINKPQEILSLLNFLDPKSFFSLTAFKKLFCDIYTDSLGNTFINGVKPDMLEEFRSMRKKLGPRRLLAEVNPGIDLPVFTPLHVDLNPIQRAMYNDIKSELQALDQAGNTLVSANVLAMLNRLRQICVATPKVVNDYYDPITEKRKQEIELEEPSSKLDMLMEFLDSLSWDDESRNQVVVFSNFEDPLKLLQKRLEKLDIPYLWMKAKHNDAQRYEMWHDTWPKKEHRVFMCTLQLGSESINLSSAQYCVFLDRSWSPKDNNQGVSRIYRPGQTNTAQIIHINAVHTTDQRIEGVNRTKQGWFEEVFGEGEYEKPKEMVDEFQELLAELDLKKEPDAFELEFNPPEPEPTRIRIGAGIKVQSELEAAEKPPAEPNYEALLAEEQAKEKAVQVPIVPDEIFEFDKDTNQVTVVKPENKEPPKAGEKLWL